MGRRTLLLVAALVVAALGTTMSSSTSTAWTTGPRPTTTWSRSWSPPPRSPRARPVSDAEDGVPSSSGRICGKSVANLPALSDIASIAEQVALAPISAGSRSSARSSASPATAPACPSRPASWPSASQLDDPARVAGFVGRRLRGRDLPHHDPEPGERRQEATRVLLPKVDVHRGRADHADPPTHGRRPRPKELPTDAADPRGRPGRGPEDRLRLRHGQDVPSACSTRSPRSTKADPGATAGNLFD